MQRVLISSYLVNLALNLASLAWLPERVASHFGARGLADGWMSRGGYVLMMVLMQTVFLAVFLGSHRLVFAVSPRWVNLPHKDYWLQPERRAVTQAMLAGWLGRMGTALFLLMAVTGLLAVQANLATPARLDMPLFWAALGLFAAYTVGWCVGFYRAFRLPDRLSRSGT